jgi:hypothetical protein
MFLRNFRRCCCWNGSAKKFWGEENHRESWSLISSTPHGHFLHGLISRLSRTIVDLASLFLIMILANTDESDDLILLRGWNSNLCKFRSIRTSLRLCERVRVKLIVRRNCVCTNVEMSGEGRLNVKCLLVAHIRVRFVWHLWRDRLWFDISRRVFPYAFLKCRRFALRFNSSSFCFFFAVDYGNDLMMMFWNFMLFLQNYHLWIQRNQIK